MIDYDKIGKRMDIECDECQEEDFTFVEFKECIEDFKEKGWIIISPKHRSDSWLHFCSKECKDEYFAYRRNKV